ncbi:MAG: pilus assembly protein [Burkholderiaceae bacterium]|nr:pilus assembly protein [Burkholderiaceae bacterium]
MRPDGLRGMGTIRIPPFRFLRRRARGVAAVELALVLPLLLLLALGVIDFSRAIQFNNVLVHLTREGANLAARTTEQPAYILKALMDTATPLEMNSAGMMYISKFEGRPDGRARLVAQYRPPSGGKGSLTSGLVQCNGSWSAGTCTPNGTQVVSLPVALNNGETVYAVESMYDYTLLTRYVVPTLPTLHSLTIL